MIIIIICQILKNHVINTICNFWEKPFYKYVYMLLYMCNVKCIFYLFKNDRNKIKINYELLLTLFCIWNPKSYIKFRNLETHKFHNCL